MEHFFFRIICVLLFSQFLIPPNVFSHDQAKPVLNSSASKRLDNISLFNALTFNPQKGEKGTITFRVLKPSIVRVRVYDLYEPELVLNPLVDWEAYSPGEYSVTWDGRDSSGFLVSPTHCRISVEAQPLRMFTLYPDTSPFKTIKFLWEFLFPANLAYSHPMSKGYHEHCLHDPALCGELSVKLSPSGVIKKDGNTSGKYILRTRLLEGKPRGYSASAGNGCRWYVNNKLVHEEIAKDPNDFQYQWDTTGLPNGMYKLSVSVCDRNDHRATDSIIVEVKN